MRAMQRRDSLGTLGEPVRYLEQRAPIVFPEEERVPEGQPHYDLRTLLYHLFLDHSGPDVTVGSDQFVYFDVVDRATGSPRHVLWTGSQNFTGAGLYYNDDTMVTMEAELASGQRLADIRSLGAWYLSRWNQLARRPVTCT